ncbi:hypothetical protein [Nodularia harveyana]|uniref:hypothetical protein n=1 Tax=Nodularia harveyana TaxID=114805 RepID=UPI002B1F3ED7|nr:hypothetical protein [Nodularia harveyana]
MLKSNYFQFHHIPADSIKVKTQCVKQFSRNQRDDNILGCKKALYSSGAIA